MTERVQMNMERMIPELEDYKNRGLFSSSELRKIIETRRKHEFRLQRPEKRLLDFVRYIRSECTLERIRDRRLRVKKADPSLHDMNIPNRIVELYKDAMYRFNDPKIVVQFTKYVMGRRMYGEMKEVFAKCCSKNPMDVDLWIYCASKLFEIDDVESSRAMFLKGLRMNPRSSRMRIEFFRMEVRYIGKMGVLNRELGLEDDDRDDVERGELAFAVFLDYFDSACLDSDGLGEVLEICEDVHELKRRIEGHVKSNVSEL